MYYQQQPSHHEPPAAATAPSRREKKIIDIIDPRTGVNVISDFHESSLQAVAESKHNEVCAD